MKNRSCLFVAFLMAEMVIDIECVDSTNLFGPEQSRNYICNLVFPALFDVLQEKPVTKSFIDKIMKRIMKLNCTWIKEEVIDIGEPNANGTYDALIGRIQRNEISGAFWPFRPDSLPHEPGIIGSVWWAADVAIFAMRKPRTPVTKDVLSVFVGIDNMMYMYTLYVLIIASVLMVVGKHLTGCGDSFWLSALNVANEYFWVLFGIYHPHLSSARVFRKVLIAAISLFGFAFIFGFVKNKVGSDLCVFFGEKDIDSVRDLLEDEEVVPWVTPRLWLYNILKASPNGTETNLIWKRVKKNADLSIEKITSRGSSAASALTALILVSLDVSTGKTAALAAERILHLSRDIACIFQRLYAEQTTIAKHTFAHGTLNSLWSHEIEKKYMRSLNFIFSCIFEGDLWQGAIQLTKLSPPVPEITINSSTIACQEGFVETHKVDWQPFDLKIMEGTFGFLLGGWFIAFIVLLQEKLLKKFLERKSRSKPAATVVFFPRHQR